MVAAAAAAAAALRSGRMIGGWVAERLNAKAQSGMLTGCEGGSEGKGWSQWNAAIAEAEGRRWRKAVEDRQRVTGGSWRMERKRRFV